MSAIESAIAYTRTYAMQTYDGKAAEVADDAAEEYAELNKQSDELVRFLINEGLVQVDDMSNKAAIPAAIKQIKELREAVEQSKIRLVLVRTARTLEKAKEATNTPIQRLEWTLASGDNPDE